jgi:hypothetical protein
MRKKRGDRGGRRDGVEAGGGGGLADGDDLGADGGLAAAWVAGVGK